MTNSFGRVWCAWCATAIVLQFLCSRALAVDTMADWVGLNNSPATNVFDSQVVGANGSPPSDENFVVISPTSIGGTVQAKIRYNFVGDQEPSVNAEHVYLSDQALDGGPRNFSTALHMQGTIAFNTPDAPAAAVEPNFCFCWYNSDDTRHRVGLGLSNVVESPFTPLPDTLRVDLFYASAAGNGFVYATKDGTQSQANDNSRVNDGTYSFTFDYVPGNDLNSTDTTGSSMSATITNGTTTWSATLAPLLNAPWFFDGFDLNKFGIIIRSTNQTSNQGDFQLTISNISYTGGTAIAGVPGDYNNNGVVDAADYVAWRKGGTLANEVDNPGTVNAADYTAWRARFGNTSGSGSGLGAGAVPEPTTALLALLAGLATVASWRRRS
jgi:hypothetical protein